MCKFYYKNLIFVHSMNFLLVFKYKITNTSLKIVLPLFYLIRYFEVFTQLKNFEIKILYKIKYFKYSSLDKREQSRGN